MLRSVRIAALALFAALLAAQPKPAFTLAPALAIEAEEFTVADGWKVVANGQGNYMVDMIGFSHISGERLLCLDAKAATGTASRAITVPEKGAYKLWVRYEYPPFTECRFRVRIEQNGKDAVNAIVGKKESPRLTALTGKPSMKAQHDPAWGPEGIAVEPVSVPMLQAGAATIYLEGVEQPQIPGVAANRNVDLVYLTRDVNDEWLKHYQARVNLYPILEAFRDTRGARWEVRLTNTGEKNGDFTIHHVYNRLPWGDGEGQVARGIAPGKGTDWVPLNRQDTAHFGATTFNSSSGSLQVEIRAKGGDKVAKIVKGVSPVRVYLPPYPGADTPTTPEEAIDGILAELKAKKAPGKVPTLPLCYGGWMPLGVESDYGRKYAQLYAALGMRSLHPANSGPAALKNLEAVGVKASKSWAVSGYRNPPTAKNIEAARNSLQRGDLAKLVQWYDYGDEIGFSEWMGTLVNETVGRVKAGGQNTTPAQVVQVLWLGWLKEKRPNAAPIDYWLPAWGEPDATQLRPDSSAAAAAGNPRLYVDSLQFYEDVSIAYVAAGAKGVKGAIGADVLCGANYSCHPFYYPTATMYINWFRGGAADMARHSEYFWQVAQPGPMINGYITEHFRAGLRDTPKGVIRQYTMPHAPGNTDASFLRSAYSHLAHGATMLDFFGIGLNETFTENHIDHRAKSRFVALRDVTHAIGFVEDLLPKAKPIRSPVALLVSASTERWDFAGIARDSAGHDHFGADFRKTRLHYHLERLGLWQAFTFQGISPDLVIEDDLTAKHLEDYRLLVVVGDCLPTEKASVLQKWVEGGGTLLATAGAGRFDPYRKPTDAYQKLFGLKERTTEEKETFFRPRQELPFLKPLARVKALGDDRSPGWPVIGVRERIVPTNEVKTIAMFDDRSGPAVVVRDLGKGKVFYLAALPGVASLWSGLQPPLVPDRGANTHSVPQKWDEEVAGLLYAVQVASGSVPSIVAEPDLIDARILKAPEGYVVPIANYTDKVGQPLTLRLLLKGVTRATSAHAGVLKVKVDGVYVEVTLPALGYGDILRLE